MAGTARIRINSYTHGLKIIIFHKIANMLLFFLKRYRFSWNERLCSPSQERKRFRYGYPCAEWFFRPPYRFSGTAPSRDRDASGLRRADRGLRSPRAAATHLKRHRCAAQALGGRRLTQLFAALRAGSEPGRTPDLRPEIRGARPGRPQEVVCRGRPGPRRRSCQGHAHGRLRAAHLVPL